jgi:hypothetical protein
MSGPFLEDKQQQTPTESEQTTTKRKWIHPNENMHTVWPLWFDGALKKYRSSKSCLKNKKRMAGDQKQADEGREKGM